MVVEGVEGVQSWQGMFGEEQVGEGGQLEGQWKMMDGEEGGEAAGDDGEEGEEADGPP